MIWLLKKLASKFPSRVQQELKRWHFWRQLHFGTFATSEPEYARLPSWVGEGDWVVDVGANVGHYTIRLSQLVGKSGRVFAFEPVPENFELLVSNVSTVCVQNVTLFNAAISSQTAVMGMSTPQFESGLVNYWMAALTPVGGQLEVLTLTLDSIALPKCVTLIKIDVEGHELSALQGMQGVLRRDHPRLIVEGTSDEVLAFLRDLGYECSHIPQSPNRTFYVPHGIA